MSDALRNIPSVGSLLEHERAGALAAAHGRTAVRDAIRQQVDALRTRVASDEEADVSAEALLSAAGAALAAQARPSLRRVVNATGVILHTGLGRAVLPEAARRSIHEELAGYAALEIDVATGERSRRDLLVRNRLRALIGAEDATVVNNNAAAVLLVLASLARGKEVIVSRGQLVEIGGSFRVPDVMAESGATLVEVGTTNRTRIEDYLDAVTENTAMLLCVHTSNFRIVGFTDSVPIEQLVLLSKDKRIPLVHDVGSGALVRLHGLDPREEPALDHSIACGADVVTASADKLLGGPQAGIIAGRRDLIEPMRRHPLARALRVDKLTLTALDATLGLCTDEAHARRHVPTIEMMSRPLETLREQARALAERIEADVPGASTELADESSRLGSGSLPEHRLPTCVVVVAIEGRSAGRLASILRAHEPPVLARIVKDRVLIDPRTLLPGDEDAILAALQAASAGAGARSD